MQIDDDGLYFLAAHDGTDPAACREARRPIIGVGEGDPRHQSEVFTDRTALLVPASLWRDWCPFCRQPRHHARWVWARGNFPYPQDSTR